MISIGRGIVEFEKTGKEYRTSPKTTVRFLINELKPLFGLYKLELHDFGRNRYYTPYYSEEKPISKLDNVPSEIHDDIRKIYVFKTILGVKRNTDSTIYYNSYTEQVFSYIENTMAPECIKSINSKYLTRWFNNKTTGTVAREMIGEELSLYKLYYAIQDTINSVDPELIWMLTPIMKNCVDIVTIE